MVPRPEDRNLPAAVAGACPGVRFVDAGDQVLKDVAGPVRAWLVHHPDLAVGFPPLRSPERYRHNLPTALGPLFGRDDDVDDLVALVGEHHLLVSAVRTAAEAPDVRRQLLLRDPSCGGGGEQLRG